MPNIAPADQIDETPIDAFNSADEGMQSTVSTHVESLKPASQQQSLSLGQRLLRSSLCSIPSHEKHATGRKVDEARVHSRVVLFDRYVSTWLAAEANDACFHGPTLARCAAAPPRQFPVINRETRAESGNVQKQKEPISRDANPRFYAGASHHPRNCVEGQKLFFCTEEQSNPIWWICEQCTSGTSG